MGRRRYEPEFPKPFDFVPFTGKTDKQNRPGHDSFRLQASVSGELLFEMMVETPLHISSGNYALTEDLGIQAKNVVRDLYKVTVQGQTLPAVPGSTLKGAARAIVEAVTNSCVGVTQERELPRGVVRGCRPPTLCPACGIFGAMSRLGRVSFSDAVVDLRQADAAIARMPALYRPRPRQGRIYKDSARMFKGRKFYYHGLPAKHREGAFIEVLTPGTRLTGQVGFSSLEEGELGVLLFALGLDNSFQLAVGGGKPVAMGRIKIKAQELRLRQAASFTTFDAGDAVLTGKTLAGALARYINAAEETLIQPAQRDKLREILNPANDRPAPTGVY
jgi:CRISPR/Cas system CSM-associated protein Csm3 (group 7 of RAMP superfamily)